MWFISGVLPLILHTDGQFNVNITTCPVKSILINTPKLSKIILQNTNTLKGDRWTCYLAKMLASQKVLTKWLKTCQTLEKDMTLKCKENIMNTLWFLVSSTACNVLSVTHTDLYTIKIALYKLTSNYFTEEKTLGYRKWKEKQFSLASSQTGCTYMDNSNNEQFCMWFSLLKATCR